jgi:hypothetical protein
MLFTTVGGMNQDQLKLLQELFKNGFVDLKSDMDIEIYKFKIKNEKLYPLRIQLGYI